MSKAGLLLTFVGLEARANKPLNKIYPTLLSWHIYPHKDLTGQVPTGNSLTPWSSPLEPTSVEKAYPPPAFQGGLTHVSGHPSLKAKICLRFLGRGVSCQGSLPPGGCPGEEVGKVLEANTASFWGNSGIPGVVYKGAYPLNASLDGQKF